MLRAARCAVVLLSSFLGLAAGAAAQQPPPPPTRAIVNVTGQLYRAQNNNHYTVFLVTPEGIIMSDPINRDFARWLKAELASRFKVPVRYVLYTHRDWDHASGGVVFADTAEFVGHDNMLAALAPPAGNPPLTADAVKMDANRNGLVERAEATGAIAERFALFDYNRDNVVSGAEIARGSVSDVYPPTTTYSDRHTVTLGGKRVTMIHLGTAHADDSSVLHFPDERAVFSADILQVRRLPGGLAPTVGSWIDALTDRQRARLRARADRTRACRHEEGCRRPASLPGGHLDRRRRRHRRRPQPRRDPEDAHARRLQGVRAVGHDPRGAHRRGLRDDQGHARRRAARHEINLVVLDDVLDESHQG